MTISGAAEMPWKKYFAQITYKNGSHKCSGVRINETKILTAAHCFFDNNRKQKQGAEQGPVW